MVKILRYGFLGIALTFAYGFAHDVAAQAYPSRPIRFIVGFPPGGGSDILTRLFAQKLSESLVQQVVVDNRPGAGGTIGAEIAAKSTPDGYTIFMASAPHSIAPSLYKKLAYDLRKDFFPISLVARQQLCLVVHPSLPPRSVKEFVAFLKSRPGQVAYASAGNGGSNHLAAELFKTMAGVEMIHVPYKGTGPSIADVLSGQVPVTFGNLLPIMPHIKSGKLRPLAVTALQRSPALPDVPTLAESGYPKYEAVNWFGILAPAGTPQEIIRRLNLEIVKTVNLQDVKDRYASLGAEPLSSTPQKATSFIENEIEKWAKVVKVSGARID
ncbi:MAG: tripartite tricarboxylate transporter substrate binding protein [Betaproteobacteria bacterium]|nr:tripartite tricarboxylate transporter substrate binding protein [Betaproteobacteria bacterium]